MHILFFGTRSRATTSRPMGAMVSGPMVKEAFRELQFDVVRVAEVVYVYKENQFSLGGGMDVVAALLEGNLGQARVIADHFGVGGKVNMLSFLAGLVRRFASKLMEKIAGPHRERRRLASKNRLALRDVRSRRRRRAVDR